MLAYLVIYRTVSRGRLGDDLWPALNTESQCRNLRVTLTYLLRVLEPRRQRGDASFFVRQDGANVSLHPGDWLRADLWELDTLCDEAANADRRGSPRLALDLGLQAVRLWRGDPTELMSELWAVAPFESRRARFAGIASRTGELVLAAGNVEHARALAEQSLRVDPWFEAAHRLVLSCHHVTRNPLAARRALDNYRQAVDELGLDPEEATTMVQRLLSTLPHPQRPGGTTAPAT